MNDTKKCFVGIDTSNYTTSVSVADEDGNVIANFKAPLCVKSGERGLRQSDAVFAHIKNLPSLMDKLSEVLGCYEPLAVGASATPRMAEGSYMPCFLSGVAAAHSFAAANVIPIFKTAHQNGHVMAALYSSGAAEKLLSDRFLAFHVSGGTTEVLLITPKDDENIFDVELMKANQGGATKYPAAILVMRLPKKLSHTALVTEIAKVDFVRMIEEL